MNYILGDVLNAEAFVAGSDGKLQHYFSAKTMTESTINISVSAEEVRGGWGNQLLGMLFHDTQFNITLNEAMWNLDYMAAQVGGTVKEDGTGKLLRQVKGQIAGETITFKPQTGDSIVAMFAEANAFCSDADSSLIVWAKDCNGNVATYSVEAATGDLTGTKIGGATLTGTEVCVSYPYSKANCRQLIVKAAYEPKEFSLYLHGKLFAGDTCAKSKSNRVGSITIEIPRFQLDGTVDLSFNPTSAVSVSLSGRALSYGCDCSADGDGKEYAKITTILDSDVQAVTDPYAKYTDIVIQDAENLNVGEPIVIYLVGSKVKPLLYTGDFTATYGEANTNALDDKYLVVAGASKQTVTVTVKLGSRDLVKEVTVQ